MSQQLERELEMQLRRAIQSGELDEPTLGPLSRELKCIANWTDEEYPSCQLWADELEDLLSFTDEKGQLERYWKSLRQSNDRRDSALMELRVARYLEQVSLPVIEWFPPGYGKSQGEFLVEAPSNQRVFVEVKSPSWKGELFGWNGKRRDAGQMERLKQPKYIHGEGGPVAPWQGIRFAIDKAYGQQKFKDDVPNLIVVADDMQVSLAHGTEIQAHTALYLSMPNNMGYFTDRRYEKLGGVGIFWTDTLEGSVAYKMRLFLNPIALYATAIPQDVQEMFRCPRSSHGEDMPVGSQTSFQRWLASQ